MYCTCSNKNNYEIISLCDIKKFTDKNGPFNNKPWVQISVADILMLDCNKLAIEKIEKVYIDVSITNTKIIETPISPAPNSEGMTLTGKKLLIDGFICSKIVYASLSKEQSVYTSNFIVPFCTYIVLEENADLFNDKYCIKTCMEDVFLSLIDCKTIFQNVTLFILAEKTSITCVNPQPPKEDCTITVTPPVPPQPITTLPNTIILKDMDNTPILDIQFDTTNNKILVSSNGKKTDPNGGTDYFKFTLYETDGTTEKITDTIGGNMNGMNFSNKISNANFQNGDIVTLAYQSSDKVIITNFPDKNTPIYTPKGREESFRITQNSLNSYVPPTPLATIPQEIKFADVARVTFDINTKNLIVTSTGNVHLPNLKNSIYFLFKLRDTSGNIKSYSSIKANENATKFATDLNNTPFAIDDIVELSSFTNRVIEIKNFPNIGRSEFVNNVYFKQDTYQGFFKITNKGLTTYNPTTILPTATLPNTIKINDITNSDLIYINFNTLDKVFETLSFAQYADKSSEYSYVSFKLYDNNNNLIYTSTLPSNNLSTSISTKLNLHILDFNYILDLTYDNKAKSNILVTNLNGKNHTPDVNIERYKITMQGLEIIPIFLPNVITITGVNDDFVANIQFDFINNNVKAISFNNLADSSSKYEYFRISFYHLTDNTLAYPFDTAALTSDDTTTAFVKVLNTILFNENAIIKITCNNKALNKINISNFPKEGENHSVTTEIEYYKITKTGLVSFTPQSILANSKISLKSHNNLYKDALTITFDPNSMLIKATALDEPISKGIVWAAKSGFIYTFKDRNGITIKTDYIYAQDKGVVGRNGSPIALANALNNTPFAYGQSIEFYAPVKDYNTILKTYMTISNVPFNSNEYWKFNDTETVTITPLGLVVQSDSPLGNTQFLKDTIIVNDQYGKLSIQIYFDISSKKFLVSTSSINVRELSQSGDGDYFVITLNDRLGNEKTIARIKENSKPDDFTTALNNYSFEYGDTINMQSLNLNKIIIKNHPNYENEYSPLLKDETFTITKLGLVSSLKILKNKITFLGLGNELIVTIIFNIDSKELICYSSGIEAHSIFKDNEYFAIVLKDGSGNTIKEASVKGNENADNFAATLNNTPFQYGYTITARFKEKDRFLVSNYPNGSDTYKSSNDTPKIFTINSTGLVLNP